MRFREFKVTLTELTAPTAATAPTAPTAPEAQKASSAFDKPTTNLGPLDAKPGAPATKDKEAQSKDNGEVLVTVTTPNGIMGPDVADVQKVLKAAGYGQLLGPFGDGGVDGIIGKYTRNTIATFQKDNNLKVTSAADIDTVNKLNQLLNTKFKGQLTKSTPAEVVRGQPGATAYNSEGGPGMGETPSARDAVAFFVSRGWTAQQAAGIVGNLQAESGANLKINAVGDSGQAYGIAQWHPDRQANFARVVGKDIREASFKEQLAFVQWELENTEAKAGSRLKQAKTAAEAAEIIDQSYERSSGQHRQARINNAMALAPTDTGSAVA